jgi:hypothetical protein
MDDFDLRNKEITEYIVVVNMRDGKGDNVHPTTPTTDLDVANRVAREAGNNFIQAFMRTKTETYSELKMGLRMQP